MNDKSSSISLRAVRDFWRWIYDFIVLTSYQEIVSLILNTKRDLARRCYESINDILGDYVHFIISSAKNDDVEFSGSSSKATADFMRDVAKDLSAMLKRYGTEYYLEKRQELADEFYEVVEMLDAMDRKDMIIPNETGLKATSIFSFLLAVGSVIIILAMGNSYPVDLSDFFLVPVAIGSFYVSSYRTRRKLNKQKKRIIEIRRKFQL